ncbi:MAG: tetratricopeptide repeat protein [Actinomycetota bacterium]|nr:tetratricopeptide repeat protein [Actinomycetota bacterium]
MEEKLFAMIRVLRFLGLRKVTTVFVALLLSVLVLFSSCSERETVRPKVRPSLAVIAQSEGALALKRAGSEWLLGCSAGVPLFGGDLIRTGSAEKATIFLQGDNWLELFPESDIRFTLDGSKLPQIEMASGRIYSECKRLSLRTPFSKVEVRDAEFNANIEPGGAATLFVYKGQAKVIANSEEKTIRSGQKISTEPGAKLLPEKISNEEIPDKPGFGYFSRLLIQPYFSSEATRDEEEDQARSQVFANPAEPWGYVNLGRALVDAGNLKQASAQFTKALKLDSQFNQALSGLGRIALFEERWDEASEFFSRARRLARDSVEPVFGLGLSRLGMGELIDAAKYFKNGIEIESADEPCWTALGITRLFSEGKSQAKECIDEALSIKPKSIAALRILALLEYLNGRLERAASIYRKVVDSDPELYDIWIALGIDDLHAGRNSRAEADFDRLSRSKDSLLVALSFQNKGVVKAIEGKFKDASSFFEKSCDFAPDRSAVQYDLGVSILLGGNYEEALKRLSSAAGNSENDWLLHDALSMGFLLSGDVANALVEAKKTLALNPVSWSAKVLSGICLTLSGEESAKNNELTGGLELSRDEYLSSLDCYVLGFGLKVKGDSKLALKRLREASKIYPFVGEYHREAGSTLEEMKDFEEALGEYRNALECNPSDTASRVRVASILLLQKKRDGAKKELEAAIEHDSGNAEARSMLAMLLADDGNFKDAVRIVEEGKRIVGLGPAALSKLWVISGIISDAQGDNEKAIAEYSRALSIDRTRGDAWYSLAVDLEKTGRLKEARDAYKNSFEYSKGKSEWKEYYIKSADKLRQLG